MDADDHFFLDWIEEQASTGGKVSHRDVDRLRLLADWADTPAPPNWDGTLDQGEALRAVESARKRLPTYVNPNELSVCDRTHITIYDLREVDRG